MLYAFHESGGRLVALPDDAPLTDAAWIDLCRPTAAESARVAALGLDVPTLADMEEIEISNRLYRENGVDYMTVVLPGHSRTENPVSGPVTLILCPTRVVTVRHHDARPFETYPTRADRVAPGCHSANALFLSLIEEVTGRLADLLESVGHTLDHLGRSVLEPRSRGRAESRLEISLRLIGKEGQLLSTIRLALLTLDRAMGFYAQIDPQRRAEMAEAFTTIRRDISALEVHVDFLSQRVAQATDVTLGMINLTQNNTVRIVSVVAVLFSPPTLIASLYGMNFAYMPELAQPYGYPLALLAMVASSIIAYAWFRWRNWL